MKGKKERAAKEAVLLTPEPSLCTSNFSTSVKTDTRQTNGAGVEGVNRSGAWPVELAGKKRNDGINGDGTLVTVI